MNYQKPLIGAAFAFAADKFVLQQPDMQKSAIFAATVGAALAAANVVEGSVPSFLPDISSLGASLSLMFDFSKRVHISLILSYYLLYLSKSSSLRFYHLFSSHVGYSSFNTFIGV